jgi:hypothetical protein
VAVAWAVAAAFAVPDSGELAIVMVVTLLVERDSASACKDYGRIGHFWKRFHTVPPNWGIHNFSGSNISSSCQSSGDPVYLEALAVPQAHQENGPRRHSDRAITIDAIHGMYAGNGAEPHTKGDTNEGESHPGNGCNGYGRCACPCRLRTNG